MALLYARNADSSSRCTGNERHASIAALLVFALTLTLGCGPKTDKLPISGEVTFDGELLGNGSIRFTSQSGETLAATGTLIRDGAFSISREKGLTPGVYFVQIKSPDRDAPPVMIDGMAITRERIPEAYNVRSDKTVEVSPDAKNHFTFEIKTAG